QHLTQKISSAAGYDFIQGWGTPDTPNLVANSSEQHVRIPGNMKPHGIAMHPSPKLQVAVGWQSPVAGVFRVDASVTHAHPECGNGATWTVEFRRGTTGRRRAAGFAKGSKEVKCGPVTTLPVQPGALISVLVGPRDGNHACDLTAVELALSDAQDPPRHWNLA